MPIKLIVYGIVALAVMGGLAKLHHMGYVSGYSERDAEYQRATQELNSRIAGLQSDLAAERQRQQEENAAATAELIASIKDEKCAALTKDEIARLNRIR